MAKRFSSHLILMLTLFCHAIGCSGERKPDQHAPAETAATQESVDASPSDVVKVPPEKPEESGTVNVARSDAEWIALPENHAPQHSRSIRVKFGLCDENGRMQRFDQKVWFSKQRKEFYECRIRCSGGGVGLTFDQDRERAFGREFECATYFTFLVDAPNVPPTRTPRGTASTGATEPRAPRRDFSRDHLVPMPSPGPIKTPLAEQGCKSLPRVTLSSWEPVPEHYGESTAILLCCSVAFFRHLIASTGSPAFSKASATIAKASDSSLGS